MKIVPYLKEMAEGYAVLQTAFERASALGAYLQSEAPVKMEFPFITAYHCGWGPLFEIDDVLRREVFNTLRRLFCYDSDPAADEPYATYAVPDHVFGMILRSILEQIRLMRARAEAEDSDVEIKSIEPLDVEGLKEQKLSLEIIPKQDLVELLTDVAIFEAHAAQSGMDPDTRRWVDLDEIERVVKGLVVPEAERQSAKIGIQTQTRDRFGVLVKIMLPPNLRIAPVGFPAARSSLLADLNAQLLDRLGGIFEYPSLAKLFGAHKTPMAGGSPTDTGDAGIYETPISIAQMLETRPLPHQVLGGSILKLRYLVRLRPDVMRSLKGRFPRGRAYDVRLHSDIFTMLNQNTKMNGRYMAMLFSNFLTNRRLRAGGSVSFLALEYHFRTEAFRLIEERFEKEFNETLARLDSDPPANLAPEDVQLKRARMYLLTDVPKAIGIMIDLLRKGAGERVLRMIEEVNDTYRKFGNIELTAPPPPSAQAAGTYPG